MKKLILFLVCMMQMAATVHAFVVRTSDLWCQRGDNKIYGRLYRPDGATGKLPLVIISHGYNGSHQWGQPYAEALAARGFLCYCYDFCGGSNTSRSDGKTTDMSIFTERADLEAIIDYFKTQADVDTKRITLFGESQGGMVSAITAADRTADVANLVLFYPALSIVDDAKARYPSLSQVPAQHDFWGMMLGHAFYEQLYDFDVWTEIAKFKKPVLLLHGDLDNVVNISYSNRASTTYKDVEYHVMNGAGHGFSGTFMTQALDYAQTFLMNQYGMTDNTFVSDQVVRQKEVENGGSGQYKAVVVSEKTLTSCTVYRPRNVKYAAQREGRLPIFIWCNGGCSDTSIDYERMLTEMASHGYLVIALGPFKMTIDERPNGGIGEGVVVDAINWIVRQERLSSSDYYHAVDVNNIALSGTSCGGAQALANCTNSRVKTLLIMNAGMGTMAMGGATPATLQQLHCPLIYMTGGTGDVAYANATVDFANITKVPVVWADLSTAGHGGTFWQPAGGDFCRLALKWMDWHMKGYTQYADIFLTPNLKDFPTWTMKHKNFPATDYMAAYRPLTTVADTLFHTESLGEGFALGADVSMQTWIENRGYTLKDRTGRARDLMVIMKNQGMNAVRLRVWVDPSGGICNIDYVKNLCSKAKRQKLDVMVDLQYSDSWTGNGIQYKPLSWQGHSIDVLEQDVYNHTNNLLRQLKGTGANLRWIQIGNSVENGILWNEGRAPENMENFVRFFQKASQAVKEVLPNAQTIVHLSTGHDTEATTSFLDILQTAGAQWDAIGLTAVPKWAGMEPEPLVEAVSANVETLSERYGCPVIVTETAYEIDRPLESNHFLMNLIESVAAAGGDGVFYREPALTDDYRLGAWNLLNGQPSIALDAFLGLKHTEVPYVMQIQWDMTDDIIYEATSSISIPVQVTHIRPERVSKVELKDKTTILATAQATNPELTPQPFTLEWTDVQHGFYDLYALSTSTDELKASTDTINVIIGPAAVFTESTIEEGDEEIPTSQHWQVPFVEPGNYMLGFKYTTNQRQLCTLYMEGESISAFSFKIAEGHPTYQTYTLSLDAAGTVDLSLAPMSDLYSLPPIQKLVIIPLDGQALPGSDDPTSLETVKSDGLPMGDGPVYDLTGRRLARPSKGLYIVKGQKVFIK